MNEFVTTVFVEQPLALPQSASRLAELILTLFIVYRLCLLPQVRFSEHFSKQVLNLGVPSCFWTWSKKQPIFLQYGFPQLAHCNLYIFGVMLIFYESAPRLIQSISCNVLLYVCVHSLGITKHPVTLIGAASSCGPFFKPLYKRPRKILQLMIKVFWNPLGTQIQNPSSSSFAVVL